MKIAVSVSGETRNYNDPGVHDYFTWGLRNLMEGHEYDLYGHTWSHCEWPCDPEKYVRIQRTDQCCVWDSFAEENFMNVFPGVDFSKLRYDDYKENFIDFLKKRLNLTYGQIWSFYESLKGVDLDEYDVILRWRWDNCSVDENIEKFWNEFQSIEDNTLLARTDVFVSTPARMTPECIAIQDTAFLLSPEAMAKIYSKTIQESLLETVGSTYPYRYETHHLWGAWLSYLQCHIAVALPMVSSQLTKDDQKPHKWWQE
jgi:hypothetical protein